MEIILTAKTEKKTWQSLCLCYKCNNWLPSDEFLKLKKTSYGKYTGLCVQCNVEFKNHEPICN